SEEEGDLSAQTVVVVGGFTLEDAEAVCEAFDVFETVMELRKHSFFRAETDPQTQESRFVMLESVRAYAAERLAETGDQGRNVRLRHAHHFLRLAQGNLGKIRTAQESAALRRLEANQPNLRAAFEWAVQEQETPLQAELGLALGILLQRQGFHRRAIAPIQVAIEAILSAQSAYPK